jgi:hypothetical protein
MASAGVSLEEVQGQGGCAPLAMGRSRCYTPIKFMEPKMISRAFDDRKNIITVTSSGFWTPDDVADHFAKLRTLINEIRGRGRPVRLLSDVTKAPRQRSSIEQQILVEMTRTFQAEDRIAILAVNQAEKVHVRAVLGHASIAVFAVRENAETWLLLEEAGEDVA